MTHFSSWRDIDFLCMGNVITLETDKNGPVASGVKARSSVEWQFLPPHLMKKNIAACLGYILPPWRQFLPQRLCVTTPARSVLRYNQRFSSRLSHHVRPPRHQQLWPVQASVWLSQAILAVICPAPQVRTNGSAASVVTS